MPDKMRKELAQQQANMVRDRQALHQIPEIGWNLPETTAYLRRALEEMELECELFQSKVLVARVGTGPAVLLRAEMDGLPVQERNSFSSHTRNCHSSGHDLHMAMLLAITRVLKAHEKELPGQAVLVFQPAGETGLGAKFMVERGFLEQYNIQSALALHLDPVFPAGQIAYNPGRTTAFLDAFLIQIQGKGGRGYNPYNAINPLEIAAQVQLILSSLLQRELPPAQQAVLSVGKAGGGVVANQIPEKAVVEGTFRCLSDEVRQYLHTRVEEISQGVCAAYRGSCSIDFTCTPAVFNDPGLHDLIFPRIQHRFGPERTSSAPVFNLGAEDLCYISQYVPTAFFHLGSGQPAGVYDEELLSTGASVLLEALLAIWQRTD